MTGGNYLTLFEVTLEYAELIGEMKLELTEKQTKTLLKVVDPLWTSVNAPSALRRFAALSAAVGEQNRTEFAEKLIGHLRTNHQDFSDRISQEAAGQLLKEIRG